MAIKKTQPTHSPSFKLSVHIPRWLIRAIRAEKASTDRDIHEIVCDQLSKRYPAETAAAQASSPTR